jgi:hypothetical protein
VDRICGLLAILSLISGCATNVPQRAPRSDSPDRVAFQCVDGRPEGAFEWRAPNGVVQIRGRFSAGRKQGLWEFWHSSGTQLVRVHYVDDVREGPVAMWYAEPCCMQGGLPYPKLEGEFAGGKYHGPKASYYPGGLFYSDRSLVTFDHGTVIAARHWNADRTEMAPEEALAQAARDVQSDEDYFEHMDRIIEESISCKGPQGP